MKKHKESAKSTRETAGIYASRINVSVQGGNGLHLPKICHNPGWKEEVRKKFRAEAEIRQEVRGKLSAAEQLAMLDERLGEGVGAVRERVRLAAMI